MANTPIWYELATRDPDAAARFYAASVGWRFGPSVMPDTDYRMIEAEDGAPGTQAGGLMGLTDEAEAAGAAPGWTMYLGVDDVDEAARGVVAAGGAVLMAPFDVEGVGRMAPVADPQGQRFWIMRPDPAVGDEPEGTAFSPTAMGRCTWNELATPDQAGAAAFYRDRFGWAQEGMMPMGDMGEYRFLQAGEVPVGAVMGSRPDHPDGWNFTFRVPDAAAAADAIRANGGTVRSGPVEVPGGMLVVQAIDPEGLLFGVCSGGDEQ